MANDLTEESSHGPSILTEESSTSAQKPVTEEKVERLCALARHFRECQGALNVLASKLDELGVDTASPEFGEFITRLLQPEGGELAKRWLSQIKPAGRVERVRNYLVSIHPDAKTAAEIGVVTGIPTNNVHSVLSILRQAGQAENTRSDRTWRWTGEPVFKKNFKFALLSDNPARKRELLRILAGWPKSKISGADLAVGLGQEGRQMGATLRALCRMGALREPLIRTHQGSEWDIVRSRVRSLLNQEIRGRK